MVSVSFCLPHSCAVPSTLCPERGWESSIIRSTGQWLVWVGEELRKKNSLGGCAQLTSMCAGKPGPASKVKVNPPREPSAASCPVPELSAALRREAFLKGSQA